MVDVEAANDTIVRVNSVSRCRTRHNMARQHCIATTVSVGIQNSACSSVRPQVARLRAVQKGRMTLQIFPYLVPQDASRCAVRKLILPSTSVLIKPWRAVRKFFLAISTLIVLRHTVRPNPMFGLIVGHGSRPQQCRTYVPRLC
jgi:hypothetical protein